MSKRRTATFIFTVLLFVLTVPLTLISCGSAKTDGEKITGSNGNGSVDDNGSNNENNGDDDMTVKITVDGKNVEFTAQFFDNSAAKELYSRLPLNIDMSDMPHEKYCYLGFTLPTSEEKPGYIHAGDIMLWGNNCLVVFYEDFGTSYSYTKIGAIVDVDGLALALKGNVSLKMQAVR